MTTQQWPDEPLPPSPPGQPSTLGQQVAHAKAEAATWPDTVRASVGLPPSPPGQPNRIGANDLAKLQRRHLWSTTNEGAYASEFYYVAAEVEALFAAPISEDSGKGPK